MLRIGVLVFVCLFAALPAGAQQSLDERIDGPAAPLAPEVVSRDAEGHATIRTTRLPSPLALDGSLSEPFYADIRPVSDFVQQEPFAGRPATEKTEVWVFFDDEHVYVSARMLETDSSRRVTSDMRRDSSNLFNNDHFAVLFDTFYDHRNGYFFYANEMGGMVDAQLTNETPNNNWNGLWDVRTARFDGGWTAEFRFPFRSLRFKEGGRLWGVNFRRVVRWKNEHSFLTPIPQSYGRRGLTKISSAGTLVGLEAPQKLRNLDIKPYALGSALTNRRANPPVNNDTGAEFGIDAKWGITQSVITDFTYNTDFAQVEDDEAQVNLTRFSVQFPEKREFFLEGQDVFNFAGGGAMQGGSGIPQAIMQNPPNNAPVLFFSRRIGLQNGQVVPILAGGRLIGRSNGFQVGALHMRTDETPRAGAVATDYSVVRVNRDVLSRSRIGVIATRRGPGAGGGYQNYSYGTDANFNFGTNLNVSSYLARTDSTNRPPPARVTSELSYRGAINWNADRTGFQLDHTFVGDQFNPEIGFLRRSAFARTFGSARYSPRPKGWRHIRKVFYEASYDYYEDPNHDPESREAQGAMRMEFTNSDQWAFEFSRMFEKLNARFVPSTGVTVPVGAYEFTQGRFLYTLSPARPVSGTLQLTYGGFYGGTLREISWRGRAEFGPRFLMEPTVSLNYFDTPYGEGDSHLLGSRLTYSITPRMFASALVQYQSASDSVSTNARFRWEYQPGSELFVVYSDGRNVSGPGFPELDNRSLVVKLTKLFRF